MAYKAKNREVLLAQVKVRNKRKKAEIKAYISAIKAKAACELCDDLSLGLFFQKFEVTLNE